MPSFRIPRWVRRVLTCLAVLAALLALVAGGLWLYLHPTVERIDGIVYGQRGARPLTLDILRPMNPNGLGIALMVSGGWRSKKAGETPVWLVAPLLRAGYTVFAICPMSPLMVLGLVPFREFPLP